MLGYAPSGSSQPAVDLKTGPALARAMHQAINAGFVQSAHDVSDGGMLTALAEMLIAGSSTGSPIGFKGSVDLNLGLALAESPSCYVVETDDPEGLAKALANHPVLVLGQLNNSDRLTWSGFDLSVEQLTTAWRGTLDW